MRQLVLLLALVAGLTFSTVAFAVDANKLMGVPRPSTAPTCADAVGIHGSSLDSCLYVCTNDTRKVLSGSGCVVATPGATVTPTPTVTATP